MSYHGTHVVVIEIPEGVARCAICIEPPPQLCLEFLGAIDIRDGDDDHFELRLDSCDAGRVVTTEYGIRPCLWLPPWLCGMKLYTTFTVDPSFTKNGPPQ